MSVGLRLIVTLTLELSGNSWLLQPREARVVGWDVTLAGCLADLGPCLIGGHVERSKIASPLRDTAR